MEIKWFLLQYHILFWVDINFGKFLLQVLSDGGMIAKNEIEARMR